MALKVPRGSDRLIATSKDWKQRRAARAMGTPTGPAPEGASALGVFHAALRQPTQGHWPSGDDDPGQM